MISEWQKEIEMRMLKNDVEKLKDKLKSMRGEASRKRGQIKRLQLLVNYILAAMNEEDFDSDPAIQKAFDKCDKAGDLS